MRVICLSDTHGLHDSVQVPGGDLLIHAGDHCNHGTAGEVRKFAKWLATLPHRHKIVIAGNHDWPWRKHRRYAAMWLKEATYLQDSGVLVDGIKVWGSPWQPEFCNWAFNLPRGPQLAAVWAGIPDDVEILITHTPPLGILDAGLGCADLAARLPQLKRLKLHVFGHVHQGYGLLRSGDTTYVNACNCDPEYRPINSPQILDLEGTFRQSRRVGDA